MIENKAMVQACLLKVSAGAAEELADYQIEVLQAAGLIQPVGNTRAETRTGTRFLEYQLTHAGKDALWPPKEK